MRMHEEIVTKVEEFVNEYFEENKRLPLDMIAEVEKIGMAVIEKELSHTLGLYADDLICGRIFDGSFSAESIANIVIDQFAVYPYKLIRSQPIGDKVINEIVAESNDEETIKEEKEFCEKHRLSEENTWTIYKFNKETGEAE